MIETKALVFRLRTVIFFVFNYVKVKALYVYIKSKRNNLHTNVCNDSVELMTVGLMNTFYRKHGGLKIRIPFNHFYVGVPFGSIGPFCFDCRLRSLSSISFLTSSWRQERRLPTTQSPTSTVLG